MSQAAYDVCASEKQLILVDGARHGYSYLVDRPRVQAALAAFLENTHHRRLSNETAA